MRIDRKDSPFGTTESEAVGKLAAEGFPELLSLVFGLLNQLVVIPLELFVELLDLGSVAVVASATAAALAAAATLTTLSATTPL